MLRQRIAEVLKTLTYREAPRSSSFGTAGDGYTYTLEEVGRIFKVTRERVRQVESKAIRKLQHPVRKRRLSSFAGQEEAGRGRRLSPHRIAKRAHARNRHLNRIAAPQKAGRCFSGPHPGRRARS